MVKITKQAKWSYLPDGTLDLGHWLDKIDKIIVTKAVRLAEGASKGLTTFYGQPCILQGLEMAEIILDLNMDEDAVAAAILISTLQHTKIELDKIQEKTNPHVAKLIKAVLQMNALQLLTYPDAIKNQTQNDRFRKLFLAMASDIRVVLIKLAERTCIMRGIRDINPIERKRLAQESMDIYAPLANRLGIGQVKWELEDLAFHYINPKIYKEIASSLKERRIEREERIENLINRLKKDFAKAHIPIQITGRAKHIYSIFVKMQRKDLLISNIYDASAVRILVPTIADCYTALSIAHHLYEHIESEFDDYITNPKPNGYRSIHTAVIDEDGKYFEIQIRTPQMHEEAEHGVAAHWAYKENKTNDEENKITVLRELIAWHKDIASKEKTFDTSLENFLEDNVYVFTPLGEIVDLPKGATPLDFAYHIHTELGHRCRGAKINGHIVPLTYTLNTGDKIEIITQQHGTPSRDWMHKDSGYLKTARARSKVAQWFKHEDQQEYIELGKKILEKELSRTELHQLALPKIALQLNFKDDRSLLAALGRGSLRVSHLLHASTVKTHHAAHEPTVIHTKKAAEIASGFSIGNEKDLLTRIARCCKPIPGDNIVGFITQGRGVSIHKQTCQNVLRNDADSQRRLIDVKWNANNPGSYFTDLEVRGYGREELLKEITSLLANAKVDLINFNSTINKSNNLLYIKMTIQIHTQLQLTDLLAQIQHLPNVINVLRLLGK